MQYTVVFSSKSSMNCINVLIWNMENAKYLNLLLMITKVKNIILSHQSMTVAVFLTLGRSRSFRFKKLGIPPKTEAEGTKFCKFPPQNSFSSHKSEVECIKYNLLDFCNYLLVTANFPFENNSFLLWWFSDVTTL